MDPTDVSILRAMGRDRIMWWGSLDPRLSAAELATRAGLPPTTVRERIRAWTTSGFLVGHAAMPNPLLLGLTLSGGAIEATDARAKARLLEDLALIEGPVMALDLVGAWIGFALACDTPKTLARTQQLLRRLPGIAGFEACAPFRVPAATITPGPLDWRVLYAIHEVPRGPIGEAARAVGVSAKTFANRYSGLVAGNALWSVPILDFAKYPNGVVARYVVEPAPGTPARLVAQGLRARLDTLLEVDNSFDHIPELANEAVEVLVALPNAAACEDVERDILRMPGIARVAVDFPRRTHVYDAWCHERLRDRATRSKEDKVPRRARQRA